MKSETGYDAYFAGQLDLAPNAHEVFEIPKRTIENWETGKRTPPAYVEKLVIRALERIAEENNSK